MKTIHFYINLLLIVVLTFSFESCAEFKVPVIEEYANAEEPKPEEPEEPEEPGENDLIIPISQSTQFPRFHTQAQIEFVAGKINKKEEPWKSAYNKLIELADFYQDREHEAVEDFHTPAFYGGQDENIDAKQGLALDSHAAYANALAYALNGDKKYGNKAIYFLNAWAAINKTITENDKDGNDTGTVLTAANLISQMMIAADLLLGQDIWAATEKTAFKTWIQSVALPQSFRLIRTKSNNWGDWGLFATAMAYHILELNDKVKEELDRIPARLPKCISADGAMPNETRREANGVWYTYYALTPITLSAQLAYNTIETNLFTWQLGEKSLKKALDYLLYYELNRTEWPHWTFTTDKVRSKDAPTDLYEAMNDYFDDEYKSFVGSFQPVLGGYKGNRVSHHGWTFATLMRVTDRKMSKYPNL